MKVIAKFTGSNSLGYEKGETYALFFIATKGKVTIKIWGSSQNSCEYASLKAFLHNWEVL